ncbi:methyltransferase [Sphingomicrobium sp. XHP0235]|uniref:class I SAM-dependent methyltransferase n=1 Tax=Sphingomicrobium aquimarinum TaxID=3133971 RepID=UPI0031FE54F2
MRLIALPALAFALASCSSVSTQDIARTAGQAVLADLIRDAVGLPLRGANNVARDQYRNPVETLAFFGVQPDDTVVEIWPGGGYYAEILAPYLADNGSYWAVASDRGLNGVRTFAGANAAAVGTVNYAAFPASGTDARVPAGAADVVLTFRNVHNWQMGNEPYGDEAFRQMYAMLKPGGTLGIVEHRLPESADAMREKTSGYMKTSTVRAMAEAAGFEYVGASEINANPRDTADYEQGVWTLPPTLRLGDTDRARYMAIGESDRMTLKFRKPS